MGYIIRSANIKSKPLISKSFPINPIIQAMLHSPDHKDRIKGVNQLVNSGISERQIAEHLTIRLYDEEEDCIRATIKAAKNSKIFDPHTAACVVGQKEFLNNENEANDYIARLSKLTDEKHLASIRSILGQKYYFTEQFNKAAKMAGLDHKFIYNDPILRLMDLRNNDGTCRDIFLLLINLPYRERASELVQNLEKIDKQSIFTAALTDTRSREAIAVKAVTQGRKGEIMGSKETEKFILCMEYMQEGIIKYLNNTSTMAYFLFEDPHSDPTILQEALKTLFFWRTMTTDYYFYASRDARPLLITFIGALDNEGQKIQKCLSNSINEQINSSSWESQLSFYASGDDSSTSQMIPYLENKGFILDKIKQYLSSQNIDDIYRALAMCGYLETKELLTLIRPIIDKCILHSSDYELTMTGLIIIGGRMDVADDECDKADIKYYHDALLKIAPSFVPRMERKMKVSVIGYNLLTHFIWPFNHSKTDILKINSILQRSLKNEKTKKDIKATVDNMLSKLKKAHSKPEHH